MTDVKIRGGHRAMATILMKDIYSIVTGVEINAIKLQAKVNELKRHFEQMTALDKNIHLSLDESEIVSDMKEASSRSIEIHECIIMAENCISEMKSANCSNRTDLNTIPQGIKLPTLILPTFDGNPLDWSHFWDIFNSAIHLRKDVSDAQKFSYLTGQLKGEAKKLLEGFNTTDANYKEAISLLSSTFGDPKRIIQSHLHALFDIKGPESNSEDLSNFRASFECHLRGLKALGTNINGAGFVIAALLLRKLPPKLRDNINRAAQSNYWELEDFRTAINQEIKLLQAIEPEEKLRKSKNSNQFNKRTNDKWNYKFNKPTSTTLHVNADGKTKISSSPTKAYRCRFCFEMHHARDCERYSTPSQKLERVEELGLCLNCLLNNHEISNCKAKAACYYCKGKHHSTLCINDDDHTTTVTSVKTSKGNLGVALPTALLNIESTSHDCVARALFDQGSQRTFILKSLAERLKLKVSGKLKLAIDSFDSKGKVNNYELVSFNVKCKNSLIRVEAIKVDRLPSRINMPGLKQACHNLKRLGIKLADPVKNDCISNIEILVGADQYYNFVHGHNRYNEIEVITSKLGSMVVGKLPKVNSLYSESSNSITVLTIADAVTDPLKDDLEKIWSLDSIGISLKEYTDDEQYSIQDFEKNVKYANGRYSVSLPWKPNHEALPTNYGLAKARLEGLLRKLKNDTSNLTCYNNIIMDQLKKGFIEQITPQTDANSNPKLHYLAHHGVKKDSVTTPLRVVFDCSAGNPSLNDCLYSGPSFVSDLGQMLLRFQLGLYGSSSDIEKAFLQIGLNEDDRDSTRFLWPADPYDSKSPLLIYRFKVVLFGATCSQFLLNAAIRYHLSQINIPLTNKILRCLYIDNILATFESEDELFSFYNLSKTIFKGAGLTLREWTSNLSDANNLFKNTGDGLSEDTDSIKVLGYKWNFKEDSISYPRRNIPEDANTKREILKYAARVYDPLGYINPVSIRSKLLLQKLWKAGYSWDEQLDDIYIQEWSSIAEDLHIALRYVTQRRKINYPKTTLHLFSDASAKAYGTAAYVVGDGVANLLMTKAKVAPVKELTIPQLELTAATLSARLLKFIYEAFKHEIIFTDTHLWTDSQVVLRWIYSKAPLKPFIQNRVDEIHKLAPNVEWNYLPSSENPCDLLSRGTSATSLLNSELWFHGPKWIHEISQWPVWNHEKTDQVVGTIYESSLLTSVVADSYSKVEAFNIFDYSSLRRLYKITSLVLRSIFNFKALINGKPLVKGTLSDHKLTLNELKAAENHWILKVQDEYFSEERSYLTNNSGKIPNRVKQLNLFVNNGVLRCHRRLDNASLSYETMNPILLPNNAYFTKLLISGIHHDNKHPGLSQMVVLIKLSWWFPRMRQVVKTVLHRCIYCKSFGMKHTFKAPPLPPLPKDRVLQSKPFSVTGIDYTSALIVKSGKKEEKVYIVLFTCAVTRALHLELVNDNSTEAFMRAFRRFISRRSCPSIVYSDNATTFVSASGHLKTLQSHPEFGSISTEKQIQWKFIPARAPWFGGFWERLIGLTKSSLKKILGNALVTKDELYTIVTEVEMGLNDRPLSYSSGNLDDLDPLTPSDLMYGHKLKGLPIPAEYLESDESFGKKSFLTKRQKHVFVTLQQFWKRWTNEYLLSLRNFSSGSNKHPDIKVGDIVLIKDPGSTLHLKLARVQHLHQGKDGFIRSVELQTSKGIITRPIVKLFPLEVSSNKGY